MVMPFPFLLSWWLEGGSKREGGSEMGVGVKGRWLSEKGAQLRVGGRIGYNHEEVSPRDGVKLRARERLRCGPEAVKRGVETDPFTYCFTHWDQFIHYSRVRKEKQNIKSVLGPHWIRLSWQSCQNIVLHSNFNSFKQKWTVLSVDNLLFKSSLSTLQRKMRTLPGNDTMPNSRQGVRLEKRTKMQRKAGRNHSGERETLLSSLKEGRERGKKSCLQEKRGKFIKSSKNFKDILRNTGITLFSPTLF